MLALVSTTVLQVASLFTPLPHQDVLGRPLILALSDGSMGPVEPPRDESPFEAPALRDEPAPQAQEETAPPHIAVLYDLGVLPEPVQRMRQLIVEAASTGDLEALAPLIGFGANQTRLALAGTDGDPIDYLRETSGDGEGRETLAILLDVLDAGFVVHEQEGEPALYVWPYFAETPLETLEPSQKVELFRIVTAGDYEEMLSYGSYNFYRVAINGDGEWVAFMAGN
jgi:hypothetical protein